LTRAGGSGVGGGAASKTRSAEVAQRYEIAWETKQIAKLQRDGYGEAFAPLGAIFDDAFSMNARQARPAMVWFLSLEPDPKAEKALFDDETVLLGARWFDCAKMYVEDMPKSERAKYVKVVPSLLFLDSRGKEITRLEGKSVAPNQVFAAMQQASAADYRDSLMTILNRYLGFLRKLDKVGAKVTDLETEAQEHRTHLEKHDCDRGRRALKETEADLFPAKAERDGLLVEEKKLLQPPIKTEPVPAEPKKVTASR